MKNIRLILQLHSPSLLFFWSFITNSSGSVFDEFVVLLLAERKCFQMNLGSLVLMIDSEKNIFHEEQILSF